MRNINQFNGSEMAVIINSLLTAARANSKVARKYKDTDHKKSAAYSAQAQEIIALYRKIANSSNAPDELNEKMDAMLRTL